MCAYSVAYRLENLLKRKEETLRTLQWALRNSDGKLAENSEVQLKAILKQIKKAKKAMAENENNT